jgi:hypothetical protein
MTEGEIITYSADVAYHGNSYCRYKLEVTPSMCGVISGLGCDIEC